jgi:hypothetical protein
MGWEEDTFNDAIHRPFEQIEHLRMILDHPIGDLAAAAEAFRRPCYLARGVYADQLERWFHWFPPERVLIIKSEAFFKEPSAWLERVLKFLELPAWKPSRLMPENQGRGRPPAISDSYYADLVAYFEPYNKRLKRLISPDWNWSDEPIHS